MPRYLYHCSACKAPFEVEKTMAQASRPETCPACQAPGTRVFTPPAIANPFTAGHDEPAGCTSCCSGGSCGLD